MSQGPQTVSIVIKDDHRELEEYYDHIVNGKDQDEQTRYQNQFVWELARHSVAEEIVIYPAMEAHLDNGKELADKDRKEHQKAKEQLYTFQGLQASDPAFLNVIKSLFKDLKKHNQDEEDIDLPALEAALASGDSEKLAKSFERTKMFVPTRSHPGAPNQPPFETAVGLLTAPIDKLKDAFSKFPQD